MEILRLLSTSEIVAQVLNFLFLLFVLRIFFWKRILKLLDDRKDRIASEFKRIEDNKKEIDVLKSDYEAKLDSIEETGREKIKEAVDRAQLVAEKINRQARLDSEKIIESAKVEIKHEIDKAREELKNKIIDLTISATESVIKERLTEQDDKKIAETFLNQVQNLE